MTIPIEITFWDVALGALYLAGAIFGAVGYFHQGRDEGGCFWELVATAVSIFCAYKFTAHVLDVITTSCG